MCLIHSYHWYAERRSVLLPSNFQSNLLSGYRFLSDKYEKGDQIFLLGKSFLHWRSEHWRDWLWFQTFSGFSRGAYQARVLAAMITKVLLPVHWSFSEVFISVQVGLLRTGNNEQIPLWDADLFHLRLSPRQPLINSAFKMYKDPKASVDGPIDEWILPDRMLVVTLLMPEIEITLQENKLIPQTSLKKLFAMMSTYISSVFGAHFFWKLVLLQLNGV